MTLVAGEEERNPNPEKTPVSLALGNFSFARFGFDIDNAEMCKPPKESFKAF